LKHGFCISKEEGRRKKEEGREHPDFANVSVAAKHSGCKSLALTNNLSTGMLRPYKIGMIPERRGKR